MTRRFGALYPYFRTACASPTSASHPIYAHSSWSYHTPDSELWRVLNSFTRLEHFKVLASKDLPLSFETHKYFLERDFVDLCHFPTLSKLSLSSATEVPIHLLHHFGSAISNCLRSASYPNRPSGVPSYTNPSRSLSTSCPSAQSPLLSTAASPTPLTYQKPSAVFGRSKFTHLPVCPCVLKSRRPAVT